MPAAPKTAKKPQDRLAKGEVKRPKSIEFEHGGRTYSISPDVADNLELFEAIEDEKYMTAIRGFVGPEQWQLYKDDHRTPDGRVPVEGFEEFLNKVTAAIGGGSEEAPNS